MALAATSYELCIDPTTNINQSRKEWAKMKLSWLRPWTKPTSAWMTWRIRKGSSFWSWSHLDQWNDRWIKGVEACWMTSWTRTFRWMEPGFIREWDVDIFQSGKSVELYMILMNLVQDSVVSNIIVDEDLWKIQHHFNAQLTPVRYAKTEAAKVWGGFFLVSLTAPWQTWGAWQCLETQFLKNIRNFSTRAFYYW